MENCANRIEKQSFFERKMELYYYNSFYQIYDVDTPKEIGEISYENRILGTGTKQWSNIKYALISRVSGMA